MARLSTDIGQFVLIPTWILRTKLTAKAVHLLCVLLTFADRDRVAFPTRGQLAQLMDCQKDTVDRHLKELRAAGLLTSSAQRGSDGNHMANVYRLHLIPRASTRKTINKSGPGWGGGGRTAAARVAARLRPGWPHGCGPIKGSRSIVPRSSTHRAPQARGRASTKKTRPEKTPPESLTVRDALAIEQSHELICRFGEAWQAHYEMPADIATRGDRRLAAELSQRFTAEELDRSIAAYFAPSAAAYYREQHHPFRVWAQNVAKLMAPARQEARDTAIADQVRVDHAARRDAAQKRNTQLHEDAAIAVARLSPAASAELRRRAEGNLAQVRADFPGWRPTPAELEQRIREAIPDLLISMGHGRSMATTAAALEAEVSAHADASL